MAQKVHPDYKEMVLHYTSTDYLLSVFYKGMEEVKYEFLRKNEKGAYIWVEMIERVYKDEKGDILALVVLNDIHERKEKEIALSFKARRDFLTTLYNREAFVVQMNDYLSYPDTESKLSAFILLDLDNFKNVNDTLGHDMGDKVLKDVAEIMKRKFRAGDLLGRLGGDEFVLLLKDVRSSEIVHRIAQEFGKMLELEYTDGTHIVKISASMGVALAPLQGNSFEELYLKADKVLYEVKKNTKNGYKIYGVNEE